MNALKLIWSAVAAKNSLEDRGLNIMIVGDIF
jgi:hypothetical protein